MTPSSHSSSSLFSILFFTSSSHISFSSSISTLTLMTKENSRFLRGCCDGSLPLRRNRPSSRREEYEYSKIRIDERRMKKIVKKPRRKEGREASQVERSLIQEFLWEKLSAKMTKVGTPSGASRHDDDSWKTIVIRLAGRRSLFHLIFTTTSERGETVEARLETNEEVKAAIGDFRRMFRGGGFAEIVAPLVATLTPSTLRINYRYIVRTANGEVATWCGLHNHAKERGEEEERRRRE